MAQFPAIIELSALDGTDGFRLNGGRSGDLSGFSVSEVGDVNGDGFADLIIGAYRADPNGDYSGSAYVVFGKIGTRDSSIELSALTSTDGFRIDGAAIDDQLGRSVAAAGDVNGDGIADIIVGAGGADPGGEYSNSGSSYVIFGRAKPFASAINVTSLNGFNGFRLDGGVSPDEFNDQAGRAVSSAGDVNGDGLDDLIVGAYRADANGNMSGSSYVVFGKTAFKASINLATLQASDGFRIDGPRNPSGLTGGYSAGYSVSPAGDMNGDGFDDVMVGAYRTNINGSYSGSTYIVFGKKGGIGSSLQLSSLNGANGFRLDGSAALDRSGRSIASAADVNGDKIGDLIIGAFLANPAGGAGPTSGATYVVFGKTGGFGSSMNLSALDGLNGFRIDGAKRQDRSGVSVDKAGDINGDGFTDLIVGAYYASPEGDNSGSVYVIFGKGNRYPSSFNLSTLDGTNGFRLDGVTDYDLSGRSVSGAGDLNGDGLGDMIVGAPGSANNGEQSGTTYIIYGQKPDVAVARVGSALDQTLAGGDFSDRLAARAGNDQVFGNGGQDSIDGGAGRDRMAGGDGSDTVTGGDGNDSAQGGTDDDVLSGDSGNDVLGGGAGRDALVGGTGTDRIYGGDGADILVSSAGHDTLAGGAGPDRFVFANVTWGGDQISDFEDGLDILRFKRSIANEVSDFKITGDGATDVTLAVGDQTLHLHGIKPIFITSADFEFVA